VTAAFRNPYAPTASGIAIIGKPRARQTVRKVCSMHSEGSTWIIAGVGDQHYRVRPRMFDLLMSGRTPEDLELEPYEPDENGDSDDFYPADDRACNAADRAIREAKEAI